MITNSLSYSVNHFIPFIQVVSLSPLHAPVWGPVVQNMVSLKLMRSLIHTKSGVFYKVFSSLSLIQEFTGKSMGT